LTEVAENSTWPFLYQAALTISATLDTDEVLQRLMRLAQHYFQADAVSVALVEPEGSLVFRAASGKSAQQIVGLRMEPGSGIVGWVAARGEPLWVPNVYEDERFYRGADDQTGFTTTAIYAVPVKLGGQTVAVLELVNPLPETDLEEAEAVLTALASLAAPAIQNARLFEKMRQAEARYQGLFQRNLDPIVILSAEGEVLELNEAARKLLACCPNGDADSGLAKLSLTPERFEALKEEVAEQEVATWELDLRTHDDELHHLEATLSYLPHYTSCIDRDAYRWMAHDVTDRVVLEEMRQNLSSMIVHDLRLPLGSIINCIELTMTAWREQDGTIPVEQVLEIGLRSAHRMERLISNILDTARLRAKERTLSVSMIDVPTLAMEALEMIQPAAHRRRQTLRAEIPANLPPMQGDPDILRRVLLNLLNNAVKYTQDGGAITFSVEVDDDEHDGFLFAVSDDGPGISHEDQLHLFELFYRGEGRRVRGAGMGLAFCQLAVEAHGGSIWVESEEGEGSTFYFTIPRQLPPDAIYLEE
jgi:signal transduction histidine kinase